jgi:alcohol dehydrogenase class IV
MEVKLLQPVKVVCTDDLGETLVDIMQTAGYSRPLMVTDSFVGSMPLVVAARTKLEQVGVDVAVAEGQSCAYSIVSFIADGNHEYAEADKRDDDAVI